MSQMYTYLAVDSFCFVILTSAFSNVSEDCIKILWYILHVIIVIITFCIYKSLLTSIPNKTICFAFPSQSVFRVVSTSGITILNLVFGTIQAALLMSISATVFPSPLGYCKSMHICDLTTTFTQKKY